MVTTPKELIRLAILGCLLLPAIALSATMEEVDQRLKKLEGEAAVNQEETDDLANRLKNNISITAYTDAEYVTTNKTGSKSGFRLHHFSVFLKKQITEKLRFFSETEWEDGPFLNNGNGTGKIFLEALNFDYQWSPEISTRVGRFFTPAGIWSIDHYPPFVLTQDRPQHIRNIFPQLVDGAALSGNHPMGSAFFNYDLYIGNGESKDFDGSGDSNSTTAVGLRAAVSLPIAQQFEIGGSLYRDKLPVLLDAAAPKKSAQGVHLKIKQGPFGFQAEYAKGSYKPTVIPNPGDYERKGYYGQISYDIADWTLGYRYDYYDSKTTTANNGIKINSAIINYHVNKNVVLKLEHHLANVENPTGQDYYRNLASIVVYLD